MDTIEPTRIRQKIMDLAILATLAEDLRAQGKRVVHAHGVFDLLHVGHIRHLRDAKRLGDVLIVTITEDVHVNKGPNRPAFTESLRAEALASLADVDYVAINRAPTAVEAIRALRPAIYVKGPDYKRPDADITGMIGVEEAAVVEVGGRIETTDDITFSSSNLINTFLPSYGAEVEDYLRELRGRWSSRALCDELQKLAQLRVVVVGEAILDEYVYVDPLGKSSKDPVLAVRYDRAETHAGGALAVANHLASFCKSVELVTYLGATEGNEKFIRSNLRPGVRPNFIYKSDSPTIVKRRYLVETLNTKLFEVYHINDTPLVADEEAAMCSLLEARLDGADAVVVADFGHGLMGPRAKELIARSGVFTAVNTQINAANIRFHAISSYERADYVCINEGELRLDARDREAPLDSLVAGLGTKLRCDRFLVTRGKRGVDYYCPQARVSAPSLATDVVDRIGAGDAVLAITSASVAAGLAPDAVAFVANVVGAQKVRTVGNSA
ncbi:MAG: adenylyltransferase/cytidyltransferase family protein, partial [Candidatus Eremiobacteraeota bacterium]|nr:adenylyltransferase/cytidyltransferase family protein [Candidatus Eremiobacteraeota bacterium]